MNWLICSSVCLPCCIVFFFPPPGWPAGGVWHVKRLWRPHGRGRGERRKDQPDSKLPASEHDTGRAAEPLQQHRRGGVCKADSRQSRRYATLQSETCSKAVWCINTRFCLEWNDICGRLDRKYKLWLQTQNKLVMVHLSGLENSFVHLWFSNALIFIYRISTIGLFWFFLSCFWFYAVFFTSKRCPKIVFPAPVRQQTSSSFYLLQPVHSYLTGDRFCLFVCLFV